MGKQVRSSIRWQRLRAQILTAFPLCVICSHVAHEVHHINAKDESSFFDISNLVPICKECHIAVSSAHRRGIDPELLFPLDKRIKIEDLIKMEVPDG